jgi:ferredoxin, 2Fe-2S
MVRVIFIEHDGTTHDIEAPEGWTLMEAAVKNGVSGIDGDCGGVCACATCHVFIEPVWLGRLGDQEAGEIDLLELSTDVKPNSRLACQIALDVSLDGLTVRMPSSQQ